MVANVIPAPNAIGRPTLVLLIHGIRTRAMWQNRIAHHLKLAGAIVSPIGYEYFNVFEFLSPLGTRARAIERVRWRMEKAIDAHPDHELIIVAHSFGTFCVSQILRQHPSIKPARIIFCGSVVDAEFKWDQLPQRPRVLNECGTKDIWPCLARSTTWGYGSSGTFGFKTPDIEDRFHAIGHSNYFEEGFAEKYWVPYVARGEVVRPEVDATAKESGILTSALASRPLWLPWLGWLAVCLLALLFFLKMPHPPPNAIVAIYPSDSFGPACREGFEAALKSAPDVRPVMIESTSIADMKAGRLDQVQRELEAAMKKFNVLGVVGPPISEIAFQTADRIATLDHRVPVLLTAAVSASDPQWQMLRDRLPLFRVGSGIGQRAQKVQGLLQYLLGQKKKIYFLTEVSPEGAPRAFGSRFFDELENQMIHASQIGRDRYEKLAFQPDRIEAIFPSLAPIMAEDAVIFILGLDFQMKRLIEEFYRQQPGRLAPRCTLIGWMNAHMLDATFRSGDYYTDRVVDISDLSWSNAAEFKEVAWRQNVAKRDAMIYHDSALVLLRALQPNLPQGNKPVSRSALAKVLAATTDALAQTDIVGIGGTVRFDGTGQNTRPLIFLKFNSERKDWTKSEQPSDLFAVTQPSLPQ